MRSSKRGQPRRSSKGEIHRGDPKRNPKRKSKAPKRKSKEEIQRGDPKRRSKVKINPRRKIEELEREDLIKRHLWETFEQSVERKIYIELNKR